MRHPSEAVRAPLSFALPILLALVLPTACAAPDVPEPEPPDAIAYEGSRIIVGNGEVIENGTLVVEQGSLTVVGDSSTVEVPAGAARRVSVNPVIVATSMPVQPSPKCSSPKNTSIRAVAIASDRRSVSLTST